MNNINPNQKEEESKKPADPLTLTNNEQNKNISIDEEKEFLKDLNCEGQKTFDLKNTKTMKENEDNLDSNNKYYDEKDYNYNDDDEYMGYYYISEVIPPQNFPEKLKKIKIKYEKLKEEIEFLKKENKKYNPNFIIKKNYYNEP